MIDLTRSSAPNRAVQLTESDPGIAWEKLPDPSIDAPPDDDLRPNPDACWLHEAERSGLCGSVSPRVLRLTDGSYRMYYTQILPREGHPAGANDYDTSTSRILSAHSADGVKWNPEPGVRLSPADGGAGEFRVVSADVSPAADGSGRLRMYYECCPGSQSSQNSIKSALSEDGLHWEMESGDRLLVARSNIMAPRIVFLDDGWIRMYVTQRGVGVVSAISSDGMVFNLEPGPRLPGDTSTFAPDLLRLPDGSYRMYFVANDSKIETFPGGSQHILTATSSDGLTWKRDPQPVISPGGIWDRVKSSELCVFSLPAITSKAPRYGMVYEGCDGTTANGRGVWRVIAAVNVS